MKLTHYLNTTKAGFERGQRFQLRNNNNRWRLLTPKSRMSEPRVSSFRFGEVLVSAAVYFWVLLHHQDVPCVQMNLLGILGR